MNKKIVDIFVCMLLISIMTILVASCTQISQTPLPSVIDQQQPNTPELHW